MLKTLDGIGTETKYSDELDSTPELNPMPKAGKGGTYIKNNVRLSRFVHQISTVIGFALGFCKRIETIGIGVSPIPGLIAFNINFWPGGSGRAHHSHITS